MNHKLIFTKIGKSCFYRFPNFLTKLFVRNFYRKLCIENELLTDTNEGFKMFASPHDFASHGIYFFGDYDQSMTSFMKKHIAKGDYCWDIGTERGWFTLLMAKLVGKGGCVDAFEAFPPNYNKLLKNIELNEFTWINPFNLAISAKNELMHFVPPSNDVTNRLSYLNDCSGVGYLTDSKKLNSIEIQSITLDQHADNVGLKRLDFIKLDIEGAEVAALKGAKQTLAKLKPKIAIEYNYGTAIRASTTIEELDDLLDCYGYDRFIYNGNLVKLNLANWEGLPDDHKVFNVYCFPRS